MSGVAIAGVIFLALLLLAVICYFVWDQRVNHAELERERGNEYRACLAIKAGSRGYFRECTDGRFKWVRI